MSTHNTVSCLIPAAICHPDHRGTLFHIPRLLSIIHDRADGDSIHIIRIPIEITVVTNTSTIAVPEDAVVRSGDKDYIFIERKPKQFEFTPISTALTEKGFIAINSGTTDLLNKVIIKKNAYAALMKMKNMGEED